jgi:diguanylate cyclase (GGDEF)-like protein
MLLPAAAPQPPTRGRQYDPVEAKAVVTTLLAAATAIGVAVQVLPVWQSLNRPVIGAMTVATFAGTVAVHRLRALPYTTASCITASGCSAIAVVQYLAGPGSAANALAAMYGLALAAAFLLYSTRVLVVQVALAALWQSLALTALGEGRTVVVTVAVTVGAAVGTGIVARKLADLRARAEAELAWRVTHDDLTGLANRSALIREWHALPPLPGAAVSVLVLDLRGFKQVNDALGHLCGDSVLVQVAQRLAALAPPAFACRLGGDEFAVLLPGVGPREAYEQARSISALLQDGYEVEGTTVPLGATIGVATQVWPLTPADADSAAPAASAAELSDLLAAADHAMYHARVLGCPVASAEQAGVPRHERRRHRRALEAP